VEAFWAVSSLVVSAANEVCLTPQQKHTLTIDSCHLYVLVFMLYLHLSLIDNAMYGVVLSYLMYSKFISLGAKANLCHCASDFRSHWS